MAFLGSGAAGRHPMVLLQVALFIVVAAVIINSSVCLGAVRQDATGVDPGALGPRNRPGARTGYDSPYTGRPCTIHTWCDPLAAGKP